jgi:uncharacterized membrane protein
LRGRFNWYAKCSLADVNAQALHGQSLSLTDAENWLALGTGALLLVLGTCRRSAVGTCLAASSAPLLYRGIAGRWPLIGPHLRRDDTKVALGGDRGIRVRESVRLEVPVEHVYRSWRRLDNLPRFMTHLNQVTEEADGRSHWIAAGPAGLAVEWHAEVINDIPNKLLAWRSLPGSDVVTAGSVNFRGLPGGRSTQVTVNLQYAPPAGEAGGLVASLFGREPSQTVRKDLRQFKELLEGSGAHGYQRHTRR